MYGQGDPNMSLWRVLKNSGYDTDVAPFSGVMGPVYNVKAYGALGDGVTDDTVAIQAALTACGVKGGIVFLPIGKYIVTGSLFIKSYTTLMGAGADYLESGNGSVIQVKQNGIMAGIPI